jgi:hypothetical protein
MGEQTVPTPPGLAANGLSQVLLFCALHKGGTRNVKERYEEYFRLGVDVLTGKDNWEESLAQGKMPHDAIPQAASSPAAGMPVSTPSAAKNVGETAPPLKKEAASATSTAIPEASAYKRWKPSEGTE